MTKLIEAVQNNSKTAQRKDTSRLLDVVRGGGANSGWVKVDWTKRF